MAAIALIGDGHVVGFVSPGLLWKDVAKIETLTLQMRLPIPATQSQQQPRSDTSHRRFILETIQTTPDAFGKYKVPTVK